MSEEIRGAVELLDVEPVEKLGSYYGGKRKWAKLIVDKYFPEGTATVLDPTAGMGWVPFEALRRGMTVHLNEASPISFTFVRGVLEGEPLDPEKFTDIKPSVGRMSKGDIYGTAPREVTRHLDTLAVKAQRTSGPRGFWAQALVANILCWGSGGHLGTWTAYEDPRWTPAMTWKGTRGILLRAHEAMLKLSKELKGKSTLTHGDARGYRWRDVDVVFLDPPYFGSGMTDYSKQYKNMNAVLLQSEEAFRFEDMTEDDFFSDILPKAIKHSKRVVLCYPAKRSIGRRLSKLGLSFRSAMLPKKLTGATISSNRAEGGTLDSNTRVYIIDGARKAGVKKAATKSWLLGTRGELIPDNESDPQATERAKLGTNFPHRADSSLLIDDGRARVLVDLGASLASELDTIKPDAVIVTHADGLAGLKNYAEAKVKPVVFVPNFVKTEGLIPEDRLRVYEPGDKIRILELPDVMTFDTGDGVGIHHKELVYSPRVKDFSFDAHLEQHGDGGGSTVWVVDGLGLGPHRGKDGESRVKGHPTLEDIVKTAQRTGVRRVVLTNIGRHGLGAEDFRSRISELTRESGVGVSVGEDELDLREVKLSSDGESFFVLGAYDPSKVTDVRLSDDLRLVSDKLLTLKEGGVTEFESEEELVAFADGIVAEVAKRGKTSFNFERMKPHAGEFVRKSLDRVEKRLADEEDDSGGEQEADEPE